jgi:dTDP-4-amino-4,6-dideoxygalactose transaminase
MKVPFFRPELLDAEIDEVADTLRSGWLTTGPKVKRFEAAFAEMVGAKYAVALNSCTAGLHLALEALEVGAGDGILVPAHTFAATAEVVRYMGAHPILVDCDPETSNMDLQDAERKIEAVRSGELQSKVPQNTPIVGMMPVHVGGYMMNLNNIRDFANKHGLWIVEDAAHAFPAAWRESESSPWIRCGENTAHVSCYSFYANKTITTGEGGMALTDDEKLAERIRLMSLHGLSRDAWGRFKTGGSWDYKIIAPGYKYNLTDIAAAIGIHQAARAESMRQVREHVATRYLAELASCEALELPADSPNHLHSWHLFPIRLVLDNLRIDRNQMIVELNQRGIGTSVHWRPLHLHPYYQDVIGWQSEDCPAASKMWERLISLPIFASMTDEETSYVVATVCELMQKHSK